MTLPFICVFISFLMIYAVKIPVAVAMIRQPGGYDNKHGRLQQKELKGWGHRIWAAHMNSFEGFPIFAAAVVTAHLFHASEHWANVFAISYVVARVFYNIFYVANWDKLRSTFWFVGFLACIGLFVISF